MPSAAAAHWSGPPAGQSGLAGPHAYRPARRKPMRAQVPPVVRNALGVMYTGLGVTAVALILSIVDMVRLDHQAAIKQFSNPALSQQDNTSLGIIVICAFCTGVVGAVMWPLCAWAVRKGRQWGAIVATAAFGLDAIPLLLILVFAHDAPLSKLMSILIWALGLVAVILLWNSQSRAFYKAFG